MLTKKSGRKSCCVSMETVFPLLMLRTKQHDMIYPYSLCAYAPMLVTAQLLSLLLSLRMQVP